MTFREKLVELRSAAGMTQEQLATAAGLPIGTLRKVEQGSTAQRFNFGYVVKLAKALGTDCTAFADCVDVAGEEEPPAEQGAKPAAKKKGKK